MQRIDIDDFIENSCETNDYTLEDYSGDTARWCKGCGDLSILTSVQRVLRDEQIDPETVVCVSGIGCSSRFPHYLKTYGFHGLHGRALPIATGVALSRPDLHVIVTMGDGDCFSIGAGHWLHAIRYNINITALVFDNEIYGLTKNQVSPTTRTGTPTSTTPRGAFLKPLNPLSVMMGVTNISFLAQTATWLPGHLEKTIKLAYYHKGLSFVRILQRCPVFSEQAFYNEGRPNLPLIFLQNDEGIEIDKSLQKFGAIQKHDHKSMEAAQKIARSEKADPMGLIYRNEDIPTYDEIRHSYVSLKTNEEKVAALNKKLDDYTI